MSNIGVFLYYVITGCALLFSLGFDINGLISFFGIHSVFPYLGIILFLCKVFIIYFYKKKYFIVFLLSFTTILFSSLDMYSHYKNSKGNNAEITFKIQETDRQIKSNLDEIKRIEGLENNLNSNYGSITKREIARKNFIERKDYLNETMRILTKEKIQLLKQTNATIDINLIKLFEIIVLELTILALIKLKIFKYKTIKKNITHRDINIIKNVIKSNISTDKKYPFNRECNEDLFNLLLQFDLIIIYKGKYYTYSEDIYNLQKKTS